MDGLQPYDAPTPTTRPIVANVHSAPALAPSPIPAASIKRPSDYLMAIRRRIWLIFLIGLPIAMLGSVMVLRMPPVYSTQAMIRIKPPKVDTSIKQLVGSGEMVMPDQVDEKYVQSTVTILSSPSFLQEVVRDPVLGLPPTAFDNGSPALEMRDKIKARPITQSNFYEVKYEGSDPDMIARTLNLVLKKFKDKVDIESRSVSENARAKVNAELNKYVEDLKTIEQDLSKLVRQGKDLAPNGRSLKAAEYEMLSNRLLHQQNQMASTRQQLQIDAMRPQGSALEARKQEKIAMLEESKKPLKRRLDHATRLVKNPRDPFVVRTLGELRDIDDEIEQVQRAGGPDPAQSQEEISQRILEEATAGVDATQERLESVLTEMKESMPEFQEYTKRMSDYDIKAKQVGSLREKLAAFSIMADSMESPVLISDLATVPTSPIRPNRTVYIGLGVIFGFGLSIGLVCLMEHVDHSVKVPEHLTAGLALPLFGVVPRMIRNARNHRAGHLWASGTPDSIEADAYRNLRASLLGASVGPEPIVTLLITSAKAGEGKSTTALNLAATCARAGERTLLMDVDLRRPSLNGVFEGQTHANGLVDVLKGDLPWQRTVVQTDLPNLDFLPTGDPTDVPIEVLGSLELRQLLLSLSQHHYDRVILDGPAVLGLADCRMLGRIVDAAILVVRSGSQEIRSLQRAKAMLEQSRVQIAGLVFNGLSDDLQNWSSYGPNPILESPISFGPRRGPSLDAPEADGRSSRRGAVAALATADASER